MVSGRDAQGTRSACESRIRESRAHSAKRRCCVCCPDADPRPYPTFDEVFDAVHDGRGRRSASSRSRTRSADRFTAITTCSSSASCRSSAKCRCRSCTTCWRCPASGSTRCGACCRTRRRWRSARGFCAACEHVEAIATYDTAGSAKMVRDEQRRDTAAIASERAGALFGLEALRTGIQDYDDNITRFLAIVAAARAARDARQDDPRVHAAERAGRALQGVERVRAARDRSVQARIAAGARAGPWEYLFYLDVAAAREDLQCARAMVHLAEFAPSLRTLGLVSAGGGNPAAIAGERAARQEGARRG